MIHLTNRQICEGLNAVGKAGNRLMDEFPNDRSVQDGMKMSLDIFLTTTGVKSQGESMMDLAERIEQDEPSHNLLNGDHRDLVGQMLSEMFEPLGGKRFVILSIPDGNEIPPTVVPIQCRNEMLISVEELKGIFAYLATTEPGDVMDL